jgi:hypothetical protein
MINTSNLDYCEYGLKLYRCYQGLLMRGKHRAQIDNARRAVADHLSYCEKCNPVWKARKEHEINAERN